MSDLIDRQDALNQITAIETSIIPYAKAREYVNELKNYVIKIIETLPSAEPERIIKIGQRSGKTLESAINYLQSTGWLQEHDRILTESAEPERKWIPVSEALPEKKEMVLITNNKGHVKCGQYQGTFDAKNLWWWKHNTLEKVLAWMPLPEPWRGE